MDDETNIRRAIELAERGRGLVSPNPMVGAVIVAPGGEVVGEGWHSRAGGPHAEIAALQTAGSAARGATLYCSLEPCDHFGRTPPCTQAIIESGLLRVVAATLDPNPITNGRGISRLKDAGIEAAAGVCEGEATRQNEAFFTHVRTGLPFVTLKLAATLDGKIAARDGSSSWITSEESRELVHRMRASCDAIVVGAGTVVADNPQLTVRGVDYQGEPVLRVVLDSTGRVPSSAKIFGNQAPTLIATTEATPVSVREAWREAGAEVLISQSDETGKVSIPDLLSDLGKRDIQSLLVEGGSTLAGSFVTGGAADKIVFFFAPKLLGGESAPSILGGEGFASLAESQAAEISSVELVGPDLKVEAYVHRNR